MSEKKMRPSGWIYAVAALIPLLGCLIAAAIAYQWFPGLPGTLESEMKLHDLTQVVVPGSEDITFAESGACPGLLLDLEDNRCGRRSRP